MRYLCLCYADPADPQPPGVFEDLRLDGLLVAAASLRAAGDTTFVRMRNGSMSVDVGPTQTRLPLDTILIIDARDFNHAIRIAASLPAARSGAVEVRPVWPAARAT